MGLIFTRIKRAGAIIFVWSMALAAVIYCAGVWLEHQQLAEEVRAIKVEHDARVGEYAVVLSEGEKLSSDTEYQTDLMKDKLGYAELDETPIVILREDDV